MNYPYYEMRNTEKIRKYISSDTYDDYEFNYIPAYVLRVFEENDVQPCNKFDISEFGNCSSIASFVVKNNKHILTNINMFDDEGIIYKKIKPSSLYTSLYEVYVYNHDKYSYIKSLREHPNADDCVSTELVNYGPSVLFYGGDGEPTRCGNYYSNFEILFLNNNRTEPLNLDRTFFFFDNNNNDITDSVYKWLTDNDIHLNKNNEIPEEHRLEFKIKFL